uniref:Putative secreted protein n=1 Tax=Xenopsylla cheopis TaxID=163159 RepID=A0A6M2DVB6_XENCH
MSLTISRPLQIALIIGAVFVLCQEEVCAKRGCVRFGHSCYGGHGKRSDQEEFSHYDAPEVTPLVDQRSLPGYELPPQSVSNVDDKAVHSNLERMIAKWLQHYRMMQVGELMKPNDGTVD